MRLTRLSSLVALLVLASAAASNPPTVMSTITVPGAVRAGAVFPNGDPWQYQLNTTDGSTGWVIHMSGGGWHFMSNRSARAVDDGLVRTAGDSGCYGICDGIMSNDRTINPDFARYNKVFILIGDRTSFTGDRWADTQARGKRGLDAVLADLAERYGLGRATDVVLTGGSSGGLATYLVCDRVADQLTKIAPAVRYACLADAGFFLDHNDKEGKPSTSPQFRESFYAWNSTAGTNQACVAHYQPVKEEWRCIFAQYVLPFIQSRLFVMQNLYDSWQMANILKLGCASYGSGLAKCGKANMTSLQAYGASMRALLAPAGSGVFAGSCIAHCQSVENEHPEALWYWPSRWGINASTAGFADSGMRYPRDVFGNWFFNRSAQVGSTHVVQQCDWGKECNALCPLFT